MILKVFFSTFRSRNNLIFQKNATCKADEIVSKPKIVLRKIVSNTERKTWQPGKAGEVYQNQETMVTPGGLTDLQFIRIEATSFWKMLTIMIVWVRKIVNWNRLQWLEVLLTFVGVGDVNFCYKSGFFKEKLTSVSKFSSSPKDSEFRCGFLIFQ